VSVQAAISNTAAMAISTTMRPPNKRRVAASCRSAADVSEVSLAKFGPETLATRAADQTNADHQHRAAAKAKNRPIETDAVSNSRDRAAGRVRTLGLSQPARASIHSAMSNPTAFQNAAARALARALPG